MSKSYQHLPLDNRITLDFVSQSHRKKQKQNPVAIQVMSTRPQREKEAAEQSGDAHAYAVATGQSERTAYRQTAQARKQSQAARDAELLQRILELKDKGNLSDNKIATQLGISRGRLQSLMRKHTAA